jgi:hypothetical protein
MIRATGKPMSAAALIKSARLSCSVRTSEKKRASTLIIINFTSSDTCKKPPRMGSQRLAPKRVCPMARTAISASDRDQIQNGRLIHDGVVVQAGEQKHQDQAHADPLELVCVHAHEMARVRRGPDFQDAHAANGEGRGQQPPIVIANARSFLHRVFYRLGGSAARLGRSPRRAPFWATHSSPCTPEFLRRSSCRNRP